MTLGEEPHFFAVSLNRNIDAPWDSSATWTPSATNSTMGGLPFPLEEQLLVYDSTLPKKCLATAPRSLSEA